MGLSCSERRQNMYAIEHPNKKAAFPPMAERRPLSGKPGNPAARPE
jgi:hypothetical protein